MGCMLGSPVEAIHVQRRGGGHFKSAVAEMQGWRSNHEDGHAMRCEGTSGGFWVLDGHGGHTAAEVGSAALMSTVLQPKDQEELLANDVISNKFKTVDENLRTFFQEHPSEDSGSTVIGAISSRQSDGTYSVKLLNAGDSRGLIIRGPREDETDCQQCEVIRPEHIVEHEEEDAQVSFPLIVSTTDHKPNHPTEKARIEAAGGFVTQEEVPRLDSNLAVSRGIGDFEYKKDKDKDASEQKCSCMPDVYEVTNLPAGSIVLLACDGLWDVCSSEDIAVGVRDRLKSEPKADLGDVAADLVRLSLARSSKDNVTVMVIHLVDGSDWAGSSDKFNDSSEMQMADVANGFSKLDELGALDEQVRDGYHAFLKKAKFPKDPIPCSTCGRWYQNMFQCPESKRYYCCKSCQKKGWKKYKAERAAGGAGAAPAAAASPKAKGGKA